MGHDYIDIGDSHLRLDDFHIWTLRALLLDATFEESPELFNTNEVSVRELRSFLESWKWLGPGMVVGCDFNNFITSPPRLTLLHSLLKLTRERLLRFGESIPLNYLDLRVNGPMAWFTVAPPVATFTDIIDRLISLAPEQVHDGDSKS